jgi:hypothetical protein
MFQGADRKLSYIAITGTGWLDDPLFPSFTVLLSKNVTLGIAREPFIVTSGRKEESILVSCQKNPDGIGGTWI